MSETRSNPTGGVATTSADVIIEKPEVADGRELWRIARDSKTLDLNSSYAYLLWCRDFSETSRVARVDGAVAGYVTGYRRPEHPDTLMVWQIAVDAAHRGVGLAARLLDDLLTGCIPGGVRFLETTVTADNEPSIRTFAALAKRWQANLRRHELFGAEAFPDGHDAEFLYRIGPVQSVTR
jgi:L-2,4-diaminobutyric acid acetyltransferase